MSTTPKSGSGQAIREATKSQASFSGHGGALGAAGVRQSSYNPENSDHLTDPGQSIAVNPGPQGFDKIKIGADWDNVEMAESGFVGKLLKKTLQVGVDLDIGCLYELSNGERGAIQAFGKKFGSFDNAPYVSLSGDETTGEASGYDEYLLVNGSKWSEIKRLLVYIYIYDGPSKWKEINPKTIIDIPGENDLVVTLKAHDDALKLCAIGGLENVRGGIKLTNYTEYFPGHLEMDRAFGFGLDWDDGEKT